MKEVKKTVSAKKSNITRKTNTPKKQNIRKDNVNKKSAVVENTKAVSSNENDDKKLIIIIGVAILIIIATIIGLLIGCNRKEEKDPVKPKDNIDTPIKVVDEEDEEERTIVVKKTTVSTDNVTYRVKYYYRDVNDSEYSLYTAKVKFGKKMSKYLPEGYESCSYFTDKGLVNRVNFNETIKSNKTVYMVCTLMRHTVKYYDYNNNEILNEYLEGTDNNNYIVADGTNACPASTKFLGWSKNSNSKVNYKANTTTNLRKDLNLTAVCGKTTVTYVNNLKNTEGPDGENVEETATTPEVTNTVVIGYTDSELANYDITSLDPVADIGLTRPTYFVPTSQTPVVGNGIKTIVSDENETVGDTEIKISDVKNRPDWYTPTVADIVEEKDYEFDGWSKKEDDGTEVEINTAADFTPDEDESKNEVEANWKLQDEDVQAPA